MRLLSKKAREPPTTQNENKRKMNQNKATGVSDPLDVRGDV